METKTIKVANGLVEGCIKNILGKDIVQFLCIPYCKSPIGELRFQRPQPCESFSNKIINKLHFETCQPQTLPIPSDNILFQVMGTPRGVEDEDSLYVNIWCPLDVLNSNDKQAVFIYIHGGGFIGGSSSSEMFDGSILSSQENIIVVSFNYRLGITGFLCLDDLIKGNMGIWDQVHAIKWIYDNISTFNGDRDNITICGCSAGGASVSLHLLIQESWPHFSKAISQCGVCIADWSYLPKDELIRRSVNCVNKILEKHKFPLKWSASLTGEEKESIVKFLQNLNVKECMEDLDAFFGTHHLSWSPCIDGELIKDYPKKLFKSGKFKKCPTIFQNARNEGCVFLAFQSLPIDEHNQVPLVLFENTMEYYPYFPIQCKPLTLEKIKNEYKIHGETLSMEVFEKVLSDVYLICPSMELAGIVSRFNEEVYYILYNTSCESLDLPKWMEVFHGSEINPLFGNYLKPTSNSSDSVKEFSKHLMAQFCYFMRNGSFKEDMYRYDTKLNRYILIEKTSWTSEIVSDDQCAKVAFWSNLRDSCD